jgi:hypothetical protein
MKGVELYGRVRYAVQIEGLSHREAGRRFGIDPRTVKKMLVFSVPLATGEASLHVDRSWIALQRSSIRFLKAIERAARSSIIRRSGSLNDFAMSMVIRVD